ncbi:M42 family metallopeptidase [Ignavigranum ruoffiae]|uniref:M42 family metallopeptidase n=1 Tax=Ignavigranum ruoffiae TaxID=89093 RepID=UPI00204DAC88|nr:M42 family metallopeptidase [Ignavigranum ruoffiae]UPQ85563.1 M42 family metallopeptidase [Ignavigranum ruoffiae]
MELNMDMLKDLTQVRGIAGNEGQVRKVFKQYAEDYSEEFLEDGLGGIFAKHVGKEDGPRLLIAGHLDEVGFMVKRITDEGFLTFQTIGGWWSQVVLAQQVEITTRQCKVFHGVTGSKPPHVLTPEARKKPIDMDDIFIDIGATSKDQVLEWGIRQGDMITPYIETRRMNEDSPFLLAKAWDNRIGMAVAIEALKFAKEQGHQSVLFSGANAQEEIGLRGAKVAPNLIKPDIAIAVDTGAAGDTPGMTAKEADSKLGKGPQIMVYDATMVGHKGLREFITDIADEANIPYQFAFMPGGGTDAGSFHIAQTGIPSICIAVPVRYLHCHTTVIHEDDYKYTVQLVNKIIEKLDTAALEEIRKNA